MRIEHFPDATLDPTGGVRVVLSRRNLRTLLAKLDGNPPGSLCTIGVPPQYGLFEVKAEEDEPHYADEAREFRGVAGRMHPATERALVVASDPPLAQWALGMLAGRRGTADTVLDPRD